VNETPIAMAQRHVVEGEDRITRQESLIAEMDQNGHVRILPEAYAHLKSLREIQKLSEEHLARLLAEQGSSIAKLAFSSR